jgi:serine protease Do
MLSHLSRLVVVFFISAQVAYGAPTPTSFSAMLEPLMPAVVNISTTQKVDGIGFPGFDSGALGSGPQADQFRELLKQFGQIQGLESEELQREVTSLGSGFVIDPEGHVVTNNHVINNATEITVIFSDNTRLPATLVGRDPQTDLALLKIKSDKPLPYVKFGSSDALKVGDWLVAVGNPFGLGGSVSAGIVSARGRNINAGPFDDFIQTDAAINRGNSGGPLFNANGEVVGINSAIFSPTGGSVGIGFAVPSDMARPIIEQLKQFGRTHRGWLGVKIQEVSDSVADALGMGKVRGALVLEINPKSPVVKSGLQPGDVITKFDGRDVSEMRQLPRMVAETKTGKQVDLTVFRKGREMTLPVTLGELKLDDAVPAKTETKPNKTGVKSNVLGMTLEPVTDEARARYGLPKKANGLLVTEINRAGEAAKNGILPGDIIRDVNQQPVDTVKALNSALEDLHKKGRNHALLRIERKTGSLFVTVPVSKD